MAYYYPITSLAVIPCPQLYFAGSFSVENMGSSNENSAILCGDKFEYKCSRDFRKSDVYTFLLARHAACKMLFEKGCQISSGPPRKSVPPRYWLYLWRSRGSRSPKTFYNTNTIFIFYLFYNRSQISSKLHIKTIISSPVTKQNHTTMLPLD